MAIAMIVVLGLAAVVALPLWPHSRQWGYVPAGGIALVAILLLLMHTLYMI